MTRVLVKITFLLALLILTACGGRNTIQEQTETQSTIEQTVSDDLDNDSEETENNLDPTNYISDTVTEQTIEELSETIVSAGTFWENWWALRGPFAEENIESVISPYYREQLNHLLIGGFRRLLPSSGFSSLDDIESYLLQYYTEAWVYERVISENNVFDEDHATLLHLIISANPFLEYDDAIFTTVERAGNPDRPNWATAAHVIKEQDGNRTVVETTVPIQSWIVGHRPSRAPRKSIYQFTLIDGKIDEMLRIEDIFDSIAPPVFDDMDVTTPHMQLLAHTLSDFFADAEPVPFQNENDTHVILVDVDGNGTPGIIASKWTTSDNYRWTQQNRPSLVRMLFYIYEDQLNYLQIGGGFSMAPAAPSRRLVQSSGAATCSMSQDMYSLLGFVDGELVPVKSIIAVEHYNLPNVSGLISENRYYVVHNYVIHNPVGYSNINENDWKQSTPITQEQFMEIAAQYGLLSMFKNSNTMDIPNEADMITS